MRGADALGPNRLVEPHRLGLGLHAELGMEPVAQGLVHLQGLRALSLFRRNLHQHPASRFAKRVEREQAPCGGRGAFMRSRGQGLVHELRQRLLGDVSQPLPLHQQPVLEG